MSRPTAALVVTAFALALAAPAPMAGQSYRLTGLSPSFDGWEERPDGTRLFSFGYINRNPTAIDIPIGPDNGFEPGAADRGQPTHFLQGRHEHVFTVVAPKQMTGKLAIGRSTRCRSDTSTSSTCPTRSTGRR